MFVLAGCFAVMLGIGLCLLAMFAAVTWRVVLWGLAA